MTRQSHIDTRHYVTVEERRITTQQGRSQGIFFYRGEGNICRRYPCRAGLSFSRKGQPGSLEERRKLPRTPSRQTVSRVLNVQSGLSRQFIVVLLFGVKEEFFLLLIIPRQEL